MDEPGETNWSRIGWITFGTALAAFVGYVVFSFLGTFVAGVFLYYALRPFHDRIESRVGHSTLSASAAVLLLLLPVLLLIGYASSIAIAELYEFALATDFGPIQEDLEPYVDVSTAIEDPASFLQDSGTIEPVFASLAAIFEYFGLLGTVLLHLFVALAVAFYLLRDDERLVRMYAVLADRNDALATYVSAVDTSLQRIFFGNLLNAFITGGIGVVVYSALNVFAPAAFEIPYPALLGILTGVGSMIPVVGMKIVYVPVAAILAGRAALAGEGWVFVALFVAVSAVVVDMIPDFLLRPYVSGRNLHVGAVMIAYVLGPLLFGWYGIFLGPLLLVLLVQFYRIVLPELLAGEPITGAPIAARSMRTSGADGTGAGRSHGDDPEPTAPGDAVATPGSETETATERNEASAVDVDEDSPTDGDEDSPTDGADDARSDSESDRR